MTQQTTNANDYRTLEQAADEIAKLAAEHPEWSRAYVNTRILARWMEPRTPRADWF